MDELRNREVTLVIGERFSGKTTAVIELIDNYEHGMVTIFDPQGEPDLAKYKKIPLERIPQQIRGVYCCTTREFKQFVLQCSKNYNHQSEKAGLIYFDDGTAYFTANEDTDVSKLISSVRHTRLDIVILFHEITRVPRYLAAKTDKVVLFKTGESEDLVRKHVEKFSHPDRLLEGFKTVEKSQKPYFYKVVKTSGIYA